MMAKLSVDQALLKAMSYNKKGKIEEAKQIYRDILRAFPENKRAQQGFAALNKSNQSPKMYGLPSEKFNQLANLYQQGQLEAVIKQGTQLIKQYPKAFIIWNIIGAANKILGQLDDACIAFSKATELNPNYADGFNNLGILLQDQGRFEDAIVSYAKALAIKPDYVEALNNMGVALHEHGKLTDAIRTYKKALAFKSDYAEAHYNMGNAFKDQGELDGAVKAYKKALAIKPDYVEALNNIGATFKEQGKVDEAIGAFTNAVSLDPNNIGAFYNMGICLKQQRKLEKAVEAYNKAVNIKPDHTEAHYNMGVALQEQGKLDTAIEAYTKALAIKPDYAEAYCNIGVALADQGKLEQAVKAYVKALAIKPDYAEAYCNIGVALADQGKLEQAVEAYNKALAIKPDYAEAYCNIGVALADQGKLEQAVEAYVKALAIKPDYAEAYCNMGLALSDQGKPEEAITAYNKSLAIEPNYADAHCNMGYALLAKKDFLQGFKHHEWRWKTKKRVDYFLKSVKPMWNGEKNQRVLVWGEQGIGDEIMFSSVIFELYAASLQVLVKCDERLIPLFKRSFPADIGYFSKSEPVPKDKYDFHIPVGSLPLTFRKSTECFRKNASGFLKCDMAKAERIKTLLTHKHGGKIIGISWKTKSALKNASNRDIKLAELATVLDRPNNQLLCLQYGDVFDEIEAVRRDFGINVIQFGEIDNMRDIDGLASLIMACDQIVSTTNATVHLAGALGAKVTALLPFSPRWIWGTGSESLWYESVTPIKQKSHNNWDNVLENLRSI
ncbi:tetratricopeptide repeat protein [Alphaproteobacteria bacterium]|jgi:tetratricopeptide (TPR) repeat protein|nr:tetratricopeptide repeat protein [Alphaproteobacteria bacterium]